MEQSTCAECGRAFGCGARTDGCWCASLAPLPAIVPGRGCLCRECLESELARLPLPAPRET